MGHLLSIKRYFFSLLAGVLLSLSATAKETEIRYRISGVNEVFLVWGVNDWQKYKKKLPNTIYAGKLMRTKMMKEGEEYVAKLDVEPGNVIDFGFMFVKKEGAFGIEAEYWDMDDSEDKKGYNTRSEEGRLISITADMGKTFLKGSVGLTSYSKYLLLVFGLLALSVFFARKYYYKKSTLGFSQPGFFISMSATLLLALFFIRVQVAGLLYSFLLNPFTVLWQMFGAAWDDIKYASILIAFFGLLFLMAKKIRRMVLVAYSIVVLLSVIAALANIRVLVLLGRPFNYQWLYYSDFLQSRDASLAMAANVKWSFISGCLMMLFSFIALAWLLYQLYLKKNLLVVSLLPLVFIISAVAQMNTEVPPLKAANPVLFFIQSMASADASAAIDKTYAGKSDFDKKNIDSLPAGYDSIFRRQKIKNVVFLVLESTPWEYVGPYSNTIKATPFLDSYKEKAVFENIYAHIPATNSSMFSFLCSSYPEISYKALTLENPDIALPSIPSELGKQGYRTVFFNSGDNGYQNAGGFLKSRGFAEVEDLKSSPCRNAIFKDKRYSKESLDGVDDSCLSVRLFNWIATDTATPFFAMMWTFQTHYPYFVAGIEKDYHTGNPSLEKYLNALNRADKTLQQITEGLQQRGLLESTLIVVCGDHGEAFGRHNQNTHAAAVYEENLHVPFILINPSLFKGERISTIGGISDIAPTIFSLLDKPSPTMWQGENLFSVNRRKRVYFFNPFSDYLFGVREGDLKLIYNATHNTYKLFDLANDPQETKDISAQKEAFVKEAGTHLRAWMYYQDQYMKNINTKADKSTK